MPEFPVAPGLAERCRSSEARTEWLRSLPALIGTLAKRWALEIGAPFLNEDVSCAWVARTSRDDGSPAVLKIGMPHMEGQDEIAGLRFWNGDPTVAILEADETTGSMLIENCDPGTSLRSQPEDEQDVVISALLRKLWRLPPAGSAFRELGLMCSYWVEETREQSEYWPDHGLVLEGLSLLEQLPGTATERALLATDLHAGNVLAASREPWLVIDPKPFVGDIVYDATQHLLNCRERMENVPWSTIDRFADLLHVDNQRLTAWMFARTAAEGRESWDDWKFDLARTLSARL